MERRSGGGRERPEDRGREAQRSLIGRLPDMVKSMLVLSLGGVFMAEETLRKATRDLKLPREAIDLVMSQADRGKRELFDAIAIEVGRAIREFDPPGFLRRFAHDFEIEIDGRIGFKPRAKGRSRAHGPRARTPHALRIRVTSDKD